MFVTVYTVHEPPDAPADIAGRADALVFVRDGFSWGAAIAPAIWFLMRREWLVLILYLCAAFLLAGGLSAAGTHADWVALCGLALNVIFGFEESTLRRSILGWFGWREIATVSGASRDECERRFFEDWLAGAMPQASRSLGHPEVRALTGGWVETQTRSLMHRLKNRFGANA